jgi:hypothetical protein
MLVLSSVCRVQGLSVLYFFVTESEISSWCKICYFADMRFYV